MNDDSKFVTRLYTAYDRAQGLVPDALSLAFGIFVLLEIVGCNGIKGPDVPNDQVGIAMPSTSETGPNANDSSADSNPSEPDIQDTGPVVADTIVQPSEPAKPVVVDPLVPVPVIPAPEPMVVEPASCADILKAKPDSPSAVYQIYIKLPGATSKSAVSVYCGMEEDNGGWMLVMGYTHKGGTNPALAVLNNKLPLFGSDTLGNDDSANPQVWGHASNALLKALSFSETRFYCRSSANAKVIHFKTSNAACKTAITEGTGSCMGIKNGFTALSKHTGTLPLGVDIADQNKGNATLVDNTFGHIIADAADVMWNVRGDVNAKSWECDAATDNESANTIHRVWVR